MTREDIATQDEVVPPRTCNSPGGTELANWKQHLQQQSPLSMQGNPLKFWMLLESLSIAKPTRPSPGDNNTPVYSYVYSQHQPCPLPWDPAASYHQRKPLSQDQVWLYTVQAGIFSLKPLYQQLYDKLNLDSEELGEFLGDSQGRLFDFRCDHQGRVLPDSLSLSLGPFAASQIIKNGPAIIDHIPELYLKFEKLWKPEFAHLAGAWCTDCQSHWTRDWTAPAKRQPLTGDSLTKLITQIVRAMDADVEWFIPEDYSRYHPTTDSSHNATQLNATQLAHIVARKRPKRYARDTYRFKLNQPDDDDTVLSQLDDPLVNSFLINDLQCIGSKPSEEWGEALRKYVMSINPSSPEHQIIRYDVRTKEQESSITALLRPRHYPAGRWPSDNALVRAQQFAVNSIYDTLRHSEGIYSVNGPPGTGKTTLLRDLFAAIITDRAAFLATLQNPASIFEKLEVRDRNDETQVFYALPQNFNDYTILVASSNNAAVENITKEIPLLSALGKSYRESPLLPDYLREEGNSFFGEETWAWLSVPLGNMKNRSLLANWTSELKKWLELNTPQNADQLWNDAVSQFCKAQAEEASHRNTLECIAELIYNNKASQSALDRLIKKRDRLQARHADLTQQIASCQKLYDTLYERQRSIEVQLNLYADWIHQHPDETFLFRLRNLRTPRNIWRYIRGRQLETALQQVTTSCELHSHDQKQLSNQITEYNTRIEACRRILETPDQCKDLSLPPQDARDKELWSPWKDPDWLNARAELFLAGIALHKAFLLCTSDIWKKNLPILRDWLLRHVDLGNKIALTSLSLWFPVLSTTFASVSSLLKGPTRHSIGWLCIDEAGQATPQAPVGALYRAKRAVVIGDPQQLTPIPPVPRTLEKRLGEQLHIPAYWQSNVVSAQILADQANIWGTWLPTTNDELLIVVGNTHNPTIWVGTPLRVHRRCLDPMFTISNTIAYDGLMVQGRGDDIADPLYEALPQSQWISVISENPNGKWIPEEGEELKKLLQILLGNTSSREEMAKGIFLISPFRDVVRELKTLTHRYGLDPRKVGTIHTTQGKQSPIVILVLGGRKDGSRDWAASTPNLLNVAVSRAQERLYIIGDRSDWAGRGVFRIAHELLGEATLSRCPSS